MHPLDPSEEVQSVKPEPGNGLAFTYKYSDFLNQNYTTICWSMDKKAVRALVEDWIEGLTNQDRRKFLSSLLLKELEI